MIRRERPFQILAALVVLFFWRPLTTGTFFFRDLYLLFIPQKVFFADAVKDGVFPLWNPLLHAGQPFISPSLWPFHPTNVLYLFLPGLAAFNILLALQPLFSALAMYWLARKLRLPPAGAFVAGAVYALGGYSLSTLNLSPIAFALPWVPLTLGHTHLLFVERRPLRPPVSVAEAAIAPPRRRFVLAAFCAAMPLLSGAAEVTGLMVLTMVAWAMAWQGKRAKRLLLIGTIVVGAVGVALIQIAPALEMMSQSSRGAKRSYEAFTDWSVDVRRLPELVVPRFFGRTDTIVDPDYWGYRVESGGFPYMLSLYFGAVTLLLAACGVPRGTRGESPISPGAQAPETIPHQPEDEIPSKVLLAIAIVALILSLGRALPFFRLIYELPLVAIFRFPVKAILAALVPVALLAGRGVTRVRFLPFVITTTLFVLLAATFQLSDGFAVRFCEAFFRWPLTPDYRMQLAGSLWHAAAALTVATVAVVAMRERRGVALAAIVLVDLAIAGWRVNVYADRDLFTPPPSVATVRAHLGDGRFWRAPEPKLLVRAPSTDLVWLPKAKMEILDDYTAATFRIPTTLHSDYDGLAPRGMERLRIAVEQAKWRQRVPILAAAGVSVFLTPDLIRTPGVRVVARGAGPDGKPRFVYSLPTGYRARFVSNAVVLPNDDAVLARMTAPGFDPETILLTGERRPLRPPKGRWPERPPLHQGCGSADVRVVERSFHRVRYAVDAPCDGFVYLAEAFYSGWTTTVDGRKTVEMRANYAFVAVPVSRGAHVLERTYFPRSLIIGGIGTLLVVAVLVTLLLRDNHALEK